jgi:hypothetical protein
MEHATPEQPERQLLHTRHIDCQGYLRGDGCFDIEARMRDISGGPSEMPFRNLAPGDALHDMRLVMTIDAQLRILRMEARTDSGPTPWCREINAAYAALEGLSIGAGFHQQARARVKGPLGCTHLTELLGPLATTAMQTVMAAQRARHPWSKLVAEDTPLARPMVYDSCHAYRADGEGVKVIWPLHRRKAAEAVTAAEPVQAAALAE